MRFINSKARERLYCIAVKTSPFFAGLILAPPENRYSAPGYLLAYTAFLVPVVIWLGALQIAIRISKNSKESVKRIKIILTALLGILSLGYARYRFAGVENWFELFLFFMGTAAMATILKNMFGIFLAPAAVALLSIATVRGQIEIIPAVLSLVFGCGALSVYIASQPELSKRWVKPLFSISLALPAVMVGFLGLQGILPPMTTLLLFTIPFVTKPNEMLAMQDIGIIKDTAAAFLLFLISGMLFGMV